jgi:hypothetical protein
VTARCPDTAGELLDLIDVGRPVEWVWLGGDQDEDLARRFGPPSSFGLSGDGLRAEIARCLAAGWQNWEIGVRFIHPALVDIGVYPCLPCLVDLRTRAGVG